MEERPARVRRMIEFLPVLGLTLVLAVAGWLVFRPASKADRVGGSPSPSGSHQPCDPQRPADSPSGGDTVEARAWRIQLDRVRVLLHLPAQDGGTYDAAPGKVFLVVDLSFSRIPGVKHAAISTDSVRMTCSDGSPLGIDGVRIDDGYCLLCGFQDETADALRNESFVYRLLAGQEHQTFLFRYGDSPVIAIRPVG